MQVYTELIMKVALHLFLEHSSFFQITMGKKEN